MSILPRITVLLPRGLRGRAPTSWAPNKSAEKPAVCPARGWVLAIQRRVPQGSLPGPNSLGRRWCYPVLGLVMSRVLKQRVTESRGGGWRGAVVLGGPRKPGTCAPEALVWADLAEADCSVLRVCLPVSTWLFACLLSPAREVSVASRGPFVRQPLDFLPPGTAVRHCDEHRGWLPPNLFNCTSVTFSELKGFVREPPRPALLPPLPSAQSHLAHPTLRKGF